MSDGDVDKLEGIIITKPEPLPKLLKTSSSGNLQGPPGKPTAVSAPDDPEPLNGYDRKRAVKAVQEILNLPPQTRGKK